MIISSWTAGPPASAVAVSLTLSVSLSVNVEELTDHALLAYHSDCCYNITIERRVLARHAL